MHVVDGLHVRSCNLFAPTIKRRYRHLKRYLTYVLLYMSKVGIHYPSLVRFFFSSNKREPRGPRDMDYIEKMYMFGNFRYLCQREREFQERGRGSFKREKDESTQAEKVVSRLNR